MEIPVTQTELALGIALIGRHPVPADGLSIVLRDNLDVPERVAVHRAKNSLCSSIPLIGRHPIPAHGLGVVLRDTSAVLVHTAQLELGLRIALIGRHPIPACGFSIVFRNALTFGVHDSEIVLGTCIALISGHPKPAQGLAVLASIIGVHASLKSSRFSILRVSRPHRRQGQCCRQNECLDHNHLPNLEMDVTDGERRMASRRRTQDRS